MKSSVAYYGIFIAFALILSYLEMLIPIHIGIPGVKLGLANLITVIVLWQRGYKSALIILILRVVLAGFLFANVFAIVYSLAGGILSLSIMALLHKTKRFGIIGISVVGGVCHNIGQILLAMILLDTVNLIIYLPILMISGVGTGLLIGLVASQVMKYLRFMAFGNGEDLG